MRRAAVVIASGLLTASAHAAEAPPPQPQSLAIEAVALPIIVDGQLINYVFCYIRLDLAPGADGLKVRFKEQYFRDDLVRVGHRQPFTRQDDYTRVDEAKVKAEVLRFARLAVGPRAIQSVSITKQVSLKLHTLPSAARSRAADIVP